MACVRNACRNERSHVILCLDIPYLQTTYTRQVLCNLMALKGHTTAVCLNIELNEW